MVIILLSVFILFFSVVIHEIAHGWVAFKLGDPTAKQAGRLTLNPLKHIDPVGTILLPCMIGLLRYFGMPMFFIGWAKPVPINFLNFRKPKRDIILVGASGPASNILIAVVFSILIKVNISHGLKYICTEGIFINLLLAFFNLVPIPPLDGSRIIFGLLPDKFAFKYAKLEPYGMIIVFVFLYLGVFRRIVLPLISIVGSLLGVSFLN